MAKVMESVNQISQVEVNFLLDALLSVSRSCPSCNIVQLILILKPGYLGFS